MFSGGFLHDLFFGSFGFMIFEQLPRLPSLSAVQQDYALSLQELSRRSVQENRVKGFHFSHGNEVPICAYRSMPICAYRSMIPRSGLRESLQNIAPIIGGKQSCFFAELPLLLGPD